MTEVAHYITEALKKKHSNLIIPIVSLIDTKGNLFLNIINDKLLHKTKVNLSGSFS